ncbi:MAG: hypothetical protein H6Q90_1157 [Deltaproteobacteria bacterium]|nr:hypothetical protein [Deltaproteobacteria bacterium]
MKRLAIIVLLGACGVSDEPSESDETVAIVPAKDAIAKTSELGPVKAVVKVWPAKPTLGDSIYVRLEVEAPAGVSIEAPFQEAGDQRLGRFRVIGFARDSHRAASGGLVQEQTYTLEAQTSGRHRVPPLRLEVIDGRGSDKSRPQELLTDEVPLEIAPVPTEAASAPLKPAAGALDPDVGGTSWLVVVGLASLVVLVGAGSVIAFRAMGARKRLEQQRSAYDEAVAQLRALQSRGAPDAETADGWFVQLSSIVRRYLESRYEIRAPELTTEEFLLVATARPELRGPHRQMLSSFLERCDRVKFAGYRPDAAESLATLEAANGFVEDTRLREAETARAA